MTPKPLAVFIADFPDDQVEDERDIVLYGGRNVAEALRQMANDIGCETSGLLYEEVKGWSFEARYEGQGFVCLATSFHPQFFVSFMAPWLSGRLAQAGFAAFWKAMDEALRRDGRFHELQWYDQEDAPAPWDDVTPSAASTAAELGAAVRERVRRVQRERRRANWGCLIAIASLLATLIGAMATIQGTIALIVNGVGEDQALVGLLLLLTGGLGVWTLYRWSKSSKNA